MGIATNDLDREGKSKRTAGGGDEAQEAARQARAAVKEEVQRLIADVESLVQRLGEAADPEVARLRADVVTALASAKVAISEGAGRVQRNIKEARAVGDRYLREKPWEAISIAGLAGLAIGFLLSRR